MNMRENRFPGLWVKKSNEKCTRQYPDRIEFRDNGLYLSTVDPGEYAIWDAGEYNRISDTEVMISTAYDAHVIYNYQMIDDLLIIEDPDGCRIEYHRV
jgi:hypothetical protein